MLNLEAWKPQPSIPSAEKSKTGRMEGWKNLLPSFLIPSICFCKHNEHTKRTKPTAISTQRARQFSRSSVLGLAAGWIAFAYYKGSSAESSRILLLHPIVPILLIVLLIRVYRWIDIRSIVILEILMIAMWIFIRLLGVLTPFILGFGFAYIFRFLWNSFPFKARYQRGIRNCTDCDCLWRAAFLHWKTG